MSIDGRHLKNAPINNVAKSQPLLSTSEKTPKMSVKVFFWPESFTYRWLWIVSIFQHRPSLSLINEVILFQERLRISINRWVVMFFIGFITGSIAFIIDTLIILLAGLKYTVIKKCILASTYHYYLAYLPMYKSMQCVSRPPILEPKKIVFLISG